MLPEKFVLFILQFKGGSRKSLNTENCIQSVTWQRHALPISISTPSTTNWNISRTTATTTTTATTRSTTPLTTPVFTSPPTRNWPCNDALFFILSTAMLLNFG